MPFLAIIDRATLVGRGASWVGGHWAASPTFRLGEPDAYLAAPRPRAYGLWITRKGAIQADAGRLVIIPGSMGTRSYVVAGRGNPQSWNSCSHGAGRRHSRSAAKRLFTAADLAEQMAGRTWLADRAESLIDEIPAAYKDIDQVMADQEDLVEVRHTLRQVLNYKGV